MQGPKPKTLVGERALHPIIVYEAFCPKPNWKPESQQPYTPILESTPYNLDLNEGLAR